jgi:hypothetical protein
LMLLLRQNRDCIAQTPRQPGCSGGVLACAHAVPAACAAHLEVACSQAGGKGAHVALRGGRAWAAAPWRWHVVRFATTPTGGGCHGQGTCRCCRAHMLRWCVCVYDVWMCCKLRRVGVRKVVRACMCARRANASHARSRWGK